MNIDEVWKTICERPEDDEPRLRFAELIEPSDPAWARFIRAQIERAHERRGGVPFVQYGQPNSENAARWARNIARFTEGGNPDGVEFFRGFPSRIDMQATVFAEYADLIFRLAPIRHIDFRTPCDDDWQPELDEKGFLVQFPLDTVLACPQLAQLDTLAFTNVNLEIGAGKKIAACPYLTRCIYLDFGADTSLSDDDIIALAEGPLTGKVLGLRNSKRNDFGDHSILERDIDRPGATEYTRYLFGDKGKELERRLGYIPWLHDCNRPSDIDLRWYVTQGPVPKFPPGSLPPRDEWYEQPPRLQHARTW